LPARVPVAVKKQIKKADKVSAWLEAIQIAGFTQAEADRIFGRPDSKLVQNARIHLRPPVEVRLDFTSRFAQLLALV